MPFDPPFRSRTSEKETQMKCLLSGKKKQHPTVRIHRSANEEHVG